MARTLDNPVLVTSIPGDDRLFVIEKEGEIRVIGPDGLRDGAFLDLRAVVEAGSLEQGLLGLAFHPDYNENGRFFVYYTDLAGDSRLVEFHASEDPNVADPEPVQEILYQAQPDVNHNSGTLEFGPDGYLWVSLGDGGGAGDPNHNGQNPNTLLSTILRLDVDSATPYAIPPDNPLVDGGGRGEVWAKGVRNPWRFTFDLVDGLLYFGDVGQDQWEEVNAVSLTEGGWNFGWPILEGFECYKTESCDDTGMTPPIFAYDHAEGCSITGGVVYRGSAIPELWGHYFYGDWCARWVRSFRYEDGAVTDEHDWTTDLGQVGQVQSFGRGGDGEIYVVTADGFVLRLVPRR